MEKIPSPCISICQMDPVKEVCIGCYRTRKEIAQWPTMNGEAQHQLLGELKQRRAEQTGISARSNARSNTGTNTGSNIRQNGKQSTS
jgi:predicted Fe-S protein YdhL (DUF1289 family)